MITSATKQLKTGEVKLLQYVLQAGLKPVSLASIMTQCANHHVHSCFILIKIIKKNQPKFLKALTKQKYIAVYWNIPCDILGNIFPYIGFNIYIVQYIAIYA